MQTTTLTSLLDLFEAFLGPIPPEVVPLAYLLCFYLLLFGVREIFDLFRFLLGVIFKWRH